MDTATAAKRRLYDITEDLRALEDLLVETGGDISDPEVASAVDAWFSELQTDLEGKVDGYAALIRMMETRAEVRKTEAKRMADLQRADENAAHRLKSRLQEHLDVLGIARVDTPHFTVSVQNAGGKVKLDVHDEEAVPQEFQRERTIIELDKEAIREALEAGREVPGAVLMERGRVLRIR